KQHEGYIGTDLINFEPQSESDGRHLSWHQTAQAEGRLAAYDSVCRHGGSSVESDSFRPE
ncbi:hypothetical protein AVEN_90719-1, partial [Araneus ventricosus]